MAAGDAGLGKRLRPWLVPALVLVGVAGLGLGLVAVGAFLEVPWCLGGGSECTGIQPIWEAGGKLFSFAGNVLFFGSPVAAGLVAWLLHVRRVGDRASRAPPQGASRLTSRGNSVT